MEYLAEIVNERGLVQRTDPPTRPIQKQGTQACWRYVEANVADAGLMGSASYDYTCAGRSVGETAGGIDLDECRGLPRW